MKHRRGKMGAVPVSNAARHGVQRATPLPAHRCYVLFFFFFISQIHPDSAPTKANSCRIGLYRPKPPKQIDSAHTGTEPTDLGRNSSKKKVCKKHHSNLSFKQQNPSPIHSSTFTLCFSSPLSHRHNQSLPKTQSHSLCHSLSIFGLFFA